MARRDNSPEPFELEMQVAAQRRATVDGWWLEFCESKPYRSMRTREQWLTSFAGYVTREYLFRGQPTSEDCSSLKPDRFQEFLLETAPRYVTVDDASLFVDALAVWMEWLCRQPDKLTNGGAIERVLRRQRRDAATAMAEKESFPSKQLVSEAIRVGIDVGDHEQLLNYFVKGESCVHMVSFYEEFLDPPHPVFHKGRALYVWEWPPQRPER